MGPVRQPPPPDSPYPWSQRHLNYNVSANFPLPRYGAAVNAVASKDGAIYIMGGLINGSTVKGDLWMIDAPPANLSCYPVATTSEGPGPRVGHASLLVGNAFIVFGGDTKTDESDMLDDTLYLLNTCAYPRANIHSRGMLTISSYQTMVKSSTCRHTPAWPLRTLAEHSRIEDLYLRWSS